MQKFSNCLGSNRSYSKKKMEEQKKQNVSTVKLSELEIPTFDRDKLKWTEFWDFFQVTVDQNCYLSNMEKFNYLKISLNGDAKQAVAGIQI